MYMCVHNRNFVRICRGGITDLSSYGGIQIAVVTVLLAYLPELQAAAKTRGVVGVDCLCPAATTIDGRCFSASPLVGCFSCF